MSSVGFMWVIHTGGQIRAPRVFGRRALRAGGLRCTFLHRSIPAQMTEKTPRAEIFCRIEFIWTPFLHRGSCRSSQDGHILTFGNVCLFGGPFPHSECVCYLPWNGLWLMATLWTSDVHSVPSSAAPLRSCRLLLMASLRSQSLSYLVFHLPSIFPSIVISH